MLHTRYKMLRFGLVLAILAAGAYSLNALGSGGARSRTVCVPVARDAPAFEGMRGGSASGDAPAVPFDLCESDFTVSFRVKAASPGVLVNASDGSYRNPRRGFVVALAAPGDPCGDSPPRAVAADYGGILAMNFGDGSSAGAGYCALWPLTDGAWHSVSVVVERGKQVSFWVDGQPPVAQGTSFRGDIRVPSVALGAEADGRFAGELRDVSIVGRALPQSDIEMLHR